MTEALEINVGRQRARRRSESDLKLELNAVGMYNRGRGRARQEGDNASRELFERLLRDEEATSTGGGQVHQMNEMGYDVYLSQQVREE